MTTTQTHIRVLLRDSATGDEAWHEYDTEYGDSQRFWWTEGNGSCDCNRLLIIHRELGKERDIDDYDCGDSRVILVRVEVDGVEQDWSV